MDEETEAAIHEHRVRIGEHLRTDGERSGREHGEPLQASLRLRQAPAEMLRRIPIAFAREKGVLPLEVRDGFLLVLAARPLPQTDLAALQLRVGMPVRVVLTEDEGALLEAIEANYRHVVALPEPGASTDTAAVRLADKILEQAVRVRASDVHLEPRANGMVVRFRIDGVLQEAGTLGVRDGQSLTAYLKTLAGLDYSLRGKPQDGHITRRIAGQDVDVRLSSIGTAFQADKVVLRILDRRRSLLRLPELGFRDQAREAILRLLGTHQGIILVAGPTGSGKTTTLNAMVLEIDAVHKNVVTLEDPVEYLLPGVTQIPVVSRGEGVTFAEGLRAVLRQDPDVIVVGETRDRETVEIAIQAALSGHLVLSSIHAADAPSTVYRLLERGVEPYMLAASLTGIVAQRLVRLICPHCREDRELDAVERTFLAQASKDYPRALPHGQGCNRCNGTGYAGREALFEILEVDEDLRGLVAQRCAPRDLRRAAEERGYVPMRDAAARLVLAGRTTVEEIARVLPVAREI